MENLKNVAPIEDFNWDEYENGESDYRLRPVTKNKRSRMTLLLTKSMTAKLLTEQ
jgi:hypothetical protein